MKKLLLFIIALSISLCSFSQVIVSLTSVPCNTGLEGSYPFTYACYDNDGGGCLDWNIPNIFLPQNAVAGPLEFINDSTPGMVTGVGVPPLVGVPKGYLGCDTLGNPSQDLTGKIAVIYRGTCEYGLKAYNAQKRGAIGVIIINHTGDAVGMGGGTYGIRVNIPVVMIGRIAGDDLRLAIESCPPDSVTGFIGSKVGFYANDMGSSMGDILMTNELAKPWYLAQNGTQFPVDLGFWAFNYGTNNQNGVTATASIVRNSNGATVYSQTSLPLNFVAPVGIVVDSQYFDLGVYSPSSWSPEIYTITYSINNTNDEDLTDNTFSFDFNLTDNFYSGSYAKSRTNSINQPISSNYLSLDESTSQYDDWEACIVFKDVNAGYMGSAIGGTFSCMPVSFDIDFEVVEIRLYEWNDIFTDINTPPTFNSLVQLVQGLYYYDYSSDGNLSGQNIYMPFDYPAYLYNNQRYLFCVYTASDSIKFGFDNQIDYKTTINHFQQPIAPLKILPNGGSSIWNWEGFGSNKIPAISLNMETTTSVDKKNLDKLTIPYPNPTTNILTIPIQKNTVGNVLVEVFDLTGKLVLSENKTIGNEPLKLNVASIKNGAYLFHLTFADGTKEVFKISVNR